MTIAGCIILLVVFVGFVWHERIVWKRSQS